MHILILLFYALLERFFGDTTQFHRHGLLVGIHAFKKKRLDDPFEVEEN